MVALVEGIVGMYICKSKDMLRKEGVLYLERHGFKFYTYGLTNMGYPEYSMQQVDLGIHVYAGRTSWICGKEISEGTKFCPYCGNQVTSEGNTPAAPEGKTGNTKKVIIALSAIVAVLP